MQQAAHEKAYDACDHTVEGQFAKGQVVSDYFGRVAWKIMTHGIRYHEDVSNCIYGVRPAKGPSGWVQSVAIREAIARVMADGTHEPYSRGASDSAAERPRGEKLAAWQDKRYNSMATCETITVYEDGVVGVCRPNYDDSPSLVWLRDAKLAKRLLAAIERCPEPVVLPTVTVKERVITLEIGKDHPRYDAYTAARDATPVGPVDWQPADTNEDRRRHTAAMANWAAKPGIKMPRSEWRRIKAELDATEEVQS